MVWQKGEITITNQKIGGIRFAGNETMSWIEKFRNDDELTERRREALTNTNFR